MENKERETAALLLCRHMCAGVCVHQGFQKVNSRLETEGSPGALENWLIQPDNKILTKCFRANTPQMQLPYLLTQDNMSSA